MTNKDWSREILECAKQLLENTYPDEKGLAELIHIFGSEVTPAVTVKPPLPPEPSDDGAYWHDPEGDGDVWHRDDSGPLPGSKWFRLADSRQFPWAEVCTVTDPTKWVRLVVDPAADASDSPYWSHRDRDGNTLLIEPSNFPDKGIVYFTPGDGFLTADKAGDLGRWLLRAAREAEQS